MGWINNYLTYLSWHKTDIIFIILLTTLTGSLCTAGLMAIRKYFGMKDATVMLMGIRLAIVAFLIPVAYFIIVYRRGKIIFPSIYLIDSLFQMGKIFGIITRFIVVLWIAAVVGRVVSLIKCWLQLHKMRKGDIPPEHELQEVLEELLKEYKIKRKIRICQNDEMCVPALAGFFKPTIIFPYRTFSVAEMQVAITHELMHYKNRDQIRKFLIEVVVLLNAWNPMVYVLRNIHTMVIEFACDERSGIEGRKYFTMQEYFNMIVDDEIKMCEPPSVTMSSFGQEPSEIERRVCYMYKKVRQTKATKYILGLALAVAMLGTSFTSYAMGEGIAAGQEYLYKNAIMDWESQVRGIKEGTEVFVMTPEDDLYNSVTEVTGLVDSRLRSYESIDWTIAKVTRVVSVSEMYLTAGSKVGYVVTVSPSNITLRIGLKDRNDTIYYNNFSGSGASEITVPNSGYYRFCVQNDSSSTVTVTGGYAY